MARLINLTTPEFGVTNGMELSFKAPCNCSDATGISLDGVTYELVDASGTSLTSCSNYFVKDAVLTVIIDTENHKATLLNPNVNNYTKTLGTPNDTASATGTTVWARLKQIISDLAGKAPSVHTHTKSQITDFAHDHDSSYYTKSVMDAKLSGKSDSGHNHDDRYYTETEMNTKLNGKSNTGHTHTKSEITDFAHNHNDLYYTETEVNNLLAGKSDTSHTHDGRYYTETEVNNLLSGKAPATHTHTKSQITDFAHNHNDIYYTESEIDTKVKALNDAIGGKSASGHTHDDRYYTETEVNNLLKGKSDTTHTHDDKYYTEGEIDAKFVSAYAEINKKSADGHVHDGRYYQKSETYSSSEIDSKLSGKASTGSVSSVQTQVNYIITGAQTVGKATVANSLSTKEVVFQNVPEDGVTWVPTAGKTYIIMKASDTFVMSFPSTGLDTMTSTHNTYDEYYCWRNSDAKPNNLYFRNTQGAKYAGKTIIREI